MCGRVADDTPDFYEDKVDEVYSFVIDNASVKVDIPTKKQNGGQSPVLFF